MLSVPLVDQATADGVMGLTGGDSYHTRQQREAAVW
jgi:hypothetical protein